jgi:hypothetical protein
MARVDAPVHRSVKNVGDGDAIYICVGGKGGYVGRDGRTAEGLSAEDAPPGAKR